MNSRFPTTTHSYLSSSRKEFARPRSGPLCRLIANWSFCIGTLGRRFALDSGSPAGAPKSLTAFLMTCGGSFPMRRDSPPGISNTCVLLPTPGPKSQLCKRRLHKSSLLLGPDPVSCPVTGEPTFSISWSRGWNLARGWFGWRSRDSCDRFDKPIDANK
jgi:hypothetical protein